MKKVLCLFLLLNAGLSLATCLKLSEPLNSIYPTGMRGAIIPSLPFPAVEVCVSSSDGFMGSVENTVWRIELKDSEGYAAAIFSQVETSDGNASKVLRGRCGAQYCKTIQVDKGEYFDGKVMAQVNRYGFPLLINVTETHAGSGVANIEFTVGSLE
jgi:hypothetical protein